MDVLSDVLRMIRLEGALFLHGQFRHPWCLQTPNGAQLAGLLLGSPQHLAICHYVLQGQCWVLLGNGESELLREGDVVVFPHGDAHRLASQRELAPVDFGQVVRPPLAELNVVSYGGAGDSSQLVCGWFAFEREIPNPLITTLPNRFSASLRQRPSGPWIEQSIRHALQTCSQSSPGAKAMTAKVAEALFMEALRGYIETLPAAQTGWLAGLRDPQVSRCLALLHAEPARAWTVDALAQAVHLSRSVLAERFSALVQMPPMQYLTRWRLAMAARLLSAEQGQVARVASLVGYESEAAFNRAFKRAYGVAPGQWRRDGVPVPAPGTDISGG